MLGFVFSRIDEPDALRPFKAPRCWVAVGVWPTMLGLLVQLSIVPVFYYTRWGRKKASSHNQK